MEREFFVNNRKEFLDKLENGSATILFSGKDVRKTADANYTFFANRNFVYLTGIEDKESLYLAEKVEGNIKETLYILPSDLMLERWSGKRIKENEAKAVSGIENIEYVDTFPKKLHTILMNGNYKTLNLDLYKCDVNDRDDESHKLVDYIKNNYSGIEINNIQPIIRKMRTIKKPCEIDAIKEAVHITKAGILAMMRASKPGMKEYEYKAEFDYALAKHGVLKPAFHSIISAGNNNFCIHYEEYTGTANEGDLILNDVGATCDNLVNDVSRAWPCGGKFTDKQKLLYNCAYETSEYMFSIIKPGMPMADVDRLTREYNFSKLKEIGLCDNYDEVGKYIWHGGAHHIGYDVHDIVDMTMPVAAGMVFCVDVGIYCEEWGIGFRLEDNCLVTEDGCVNLTAAIPRSIEEIEEAMKK